MGSDIDLVGRTFGRWTVISRAKDKDKNRFKFWKCRCSCGVESYVRQDALLSGRSKCCGCVRYESNKKAITHGGTRERLYSVWRSMKERCNDTNNKHYGARGISVCEEWSRSYASFRKWALENGYDSNAGKHECTLDRIDNDGNYCPENCRWVNWSEQMRNKRPESYKPTHQKPVLRIDKQGNKKEYPSVRAACRDIRGTENGAANISECCKGRRKSAYGYEWEYVIREAVSADE